MKRSRNRSYFDECGRRWRSLTLLASLRRPPSSCAYIALHGPIFLSRLSETNAWQASSKGRAILRTRILRTNFMKTRIAALASLFFLFQLPGFAQVQVVVFSDSAAGEIQTNRNAQIGSPGVPGSGILVVGSLLAPSS